MKRLLLLKFVCILIGGIILSSCSEEARLKRITSRFVESKIVIPHGLYDSGKQEDYCPQPW